MRHILTVYYRQVLRTNDHQYKTLITMCVTSQKLCTRKQKPQAIPPPGLPNLVLPPML